MTNHEQSAESVARLGRLDVELLADGWRLVDQYGQRVTLTTDLLRVLVAAFNYCNLGTHIDG